MTQCTPKLPDDNIPVMSGVSGTAARPSHRLTARKGVNLRDLQIPEQEYPIDACHRESLQVGSSAGPALWLPEALSPRQARADVPAPDR